jgi:uncharacterized membrane protein
MDSKHTIELIATAFELVGVGILVLGSIIAFVHYLVTFIRLRQNHVAYRHLRLDLGRAILVALELLIIADIIRSVAIDSTFASVGVLGLIVLARKRANQQIPTSSEVRHGSPAVVRGMKWIVSPNGCLNGCDWR